MAESCLKHTEQLSRAGLQTSVQQFRAQKAESVSCTTAYVLLEAMLHVSPNVLSAVREGARGGDLEVVGNGR